MTIPTARSLAAAQGLCQDGVRGRLPKAALEFLATKVEGVDYLPVKKPGAPNPEAQAKRAEREAAKREAQAAAKAAKDKERAEARQAAAKAATPSGPTAKVATGVKMPRVKGQPTKAYTIVYPTADGRKSGHTAFLWSPQTCVKGHRIGYCPCKVPTAPAMPGEGVLHDGGVLMWSKPGSL